MSKITYPEITLQPLSQKPSDVEVDQAFKNAVNLHRARQLQQAEQICRQILNFQPNHVPAMQLLGIIGMQIGQLTPSIKIFKKALKKDPGNAELYGNLGMAQHQAGELKDAESSFRKAVKLQPRSPMTHYNLGINLQAQGQPEGAADAFHKAIAINHQYPDAWNNLGSVLQLKNKHDEAIEAYNKALEFRPDFLLAKLNLSTALFSKKEYAQARILLEQIITLKPDYDDAWYNLGMVLEAEENQELAESNYRKAIELNPEYIEAYNHLGLLLFDTGKTEEGLSMIDKALSINPAHAGAISNKITLLLNSHKSDELIQFLEKFPPPDIGDTYNMVKLLAAQKRSRVYLAERKSDNLTLVVKVLEIPAVVKDPSGPYAKKSTQENIFNEFIKEGKTLAEISSPFVIKIYEHGSVNDNCFIAMEYCTGGNLHQKQKQQLTPDTVIRYMADIAMGLDTIHRMGIIHRDLKPENILFRDDGSLVLADFGLSIKLDPISEFWEGKQRAGTYGYMSPEQYERKNLDQRSDLYSLGVIYYELLTGKRPYPGKTRYELATQHVHDPIPCLPAELARYQEIIDRTMAKVPADRYQSATELIQALESVTNLH
jgi:Tfp pilus assembly protein PilF/predicted Ser/Thr protein kinase